MLKIGDSVGSICKYTIGLDGKSEYKLRESKINKIVENKFGKKYYTQNNFYPLDCEEVDSNTKMFEEAEGFILVETVVGLNEVTRVRAERWVEWANKNPDKIDKLFS